MTFDELHKRQIPASEEHDPLSEAAIGALIEVHRHLGPGHRESVYEEAVCHELELRGIPYARQVPVDVLYKGNRVGEGRIDLVIAGKLFVELKACESLAPIHKAQCISYLRVTGLKVALLVNFNVEVLKDGIKRIVLTK